VPFLILEDVHRVDADQAERIVTMLDARVARGKPTVVTSNAAPAELTHLPNRLTNRLAGGLVLGFRPFSDASRARMAMRIAKRGGRTLTKAKARTIAKAKPGSLRKIEAAVQEEFLTYAPPASKSKRPRMPNRDALARLEELAVRVAKAFQTTPEELRSRAQSWHLATVRQTFTRLAYRHLGIAYTQIEGFLGRKGMAMSGPLLDAKLMKDAKLKLLFERLEAETGKPIRK
jgi:chromosomal replication initiation ATPase DnaA